MPKGRVKNYWEKTNEPCWQIPFLRWSSLQWRMGPRGTIILHPIENCWWKWIEEKHYTRQRQTDLSITHGIKTQAETHRCVFCFTKIKQNKQDYMMNRLRTAFYNDANRTISMSVEGNLRQDVRQVWTDCWSNDNHRWLKLRQLFNHTFHATK